MLPIVTCEVPKLLSSKLLAPYLVPSLLTLEQRIVGQTFPIVLALLCILPTSGLDNFFTENFGFFSIFNFIYFHDNKIDI